MSLLLSCQTDMAFWQNFLPQVLHSLRTSREHGISLFPIFRATNRNISKKSCKERPKSPSLTLHYCNNCHHYSCVSIRRAQYLRGLSPQSGQLFSLQRSPPPHYQPLGALFWHRTKTILFAPPPPPPLKKKNHYWAWTHLKREPSTERQQTVWKFTWSHWTACWILEGWYLRKWFVSPQSLGPLTQSLSAETESMGFPIHSSRGISRRSDKGIIMSLIKWSMS